MKCENLMKSGINYNNVKSQKLTAINWMSKKLKNVIVFNWIYDIAMTFFIFLKFLLPNYKFRQLHTNKKKKIMTN